MTADAQGATVQTPRRRKRRDAPAPGMRRSPLRVLLDYGVLVLATVVMLAPFVLALVTAFTSKQQFTREGALAIPNPPTIENFLALSGRRVDFGDAFLTTLAVVVIVTIAQLVFSVFAAYAFARLRFPGRDALFWVFLATLMVPQVVVLIPLYFMLTDWHLRATFLGLVLPYLFGSPYAVFLLREQFRQIPQELIDAMRIDGAGTWRVLFGLVVPLSRPTLVTLALITVVTHWNNFMWPLLIGGNKVPVLTTAMAQLQEQYQNNLTLVMAASTVAMLPLIVLFVLFQKQIVRSIRITGFR